jgi:uncharacterized repeat protein (TIGR03943 family)
VRTQRLILLLFGAILLRLASGDALLRYVRPGARLPVLAAGAMLVLITVVTATRRRTGAASRLQWAVLVPALAVAVVTPPALGPASADRPPPTPPRPARGFPRLPTGDPVDIGLVDIVLRSLWGAGDSLRGRVLQTVGFVSHVAPGSFVLTRFVITCCAADAQPYDVEVRWRGPPPQRGAWVEVSARFVGRSAGNRLVPRVVAAAVSAVPAPADPYE